MIENLAKREKGAKNAPFSLEVGPLGSGLGQGSLGLFDQGCEAGSIVDGDVGQDFAVKLDAGFFEAIDELRVADAILLGGGIDAHDPERAELALFLAAARVSEFESALNGLLGGLVKLGFCKEITFGALQDLFAPVGAFGSTFNAGHCFVLLFAFRFAAGGRSFRFDLFTRILT
jgi:hypothetical protein